MLEWVAYCVFVACAAVFVLYYVVKVIVSIVIGIREWLLK